MTTRTRQAPRVRDEAEEPVGGTSLAMATRLVAEREVVTFLRMKGFWIGLAVLLASRLYAGSLLLTRGKVALSKAWTRVD